MELRSNGTVLKGLPGNALGSGIVRSMTPELLLDLIGVRLNGPQSPRTSRSRSNSSSPTGATSAGVSASRHGVLHARRDARGVGSVGVICSLAAFAVFATGSRTSTNCSRATTSR